MRAVLSAVVLLLTISSGRAEPGCADAEVIELYAEAFKCEIVACNGNVIRGTSRDLAKMSDAELRQRTLNLVLDKSPPDLKAQPYFVKIVSFMAGLSASTNIAWRDAFRTMKVRATSLAYDQSRRRHTCQGRVTFAPSLLSDALRRYALQLAMTESTTKKLVMNKIAEDRDPAPLLAEMAKLAEKTLTSCFNTNRIFYVQSMSDKKFVVNLDRNTLVPGCRKF